jgi:hypothetical protein
VRLLDETLQSRGQRFMRKRRSNFEMLLDSGNGKSFRWKK